MYLQNRMNAAFILSALQSVDAANNVNTQFEAVTIQPGGYAEVDKAHFDAVAKNNPALMALMGERKLVPTDNAPSGDRYELVDAVDLTPPPQLQDVPEGVKREGKVESLDITEDVAPSRAKGRKG